MSLELEHIWSRVQAQLIAVVDEPTYRLWLSALQPAELIGETLVVEAPPQTCRWIQGRFGRLLEDAVELVLGPHATIELRPAGTGRTPAASLPQRGGRSAPGPAATRSSRSTSS